MKTQAGKNPGPNHICHHQGRGRINANISFQFGRVLRTYNLGYCTHKTKPIVPITIQSSGLSNQQAVSKHRSDGYPGNFIG